MQAHTTEEKIIVNKLVPKSDDIMKESMEEPKFEESEKKQILNDAHSRLEVKSFSFLSQNPIKKVRQDFDFSKWSLEKMMKECAKYGKIPKTRELMEKRLSYISNALL